MAAKKKSVAKKSSAKKTPVKAKDKSKSKPAKASPKLKAKTKATAKAAPKAVAPKAKASPKAPAPKAIAIAKPTAFKSNALKPLDDRLIVAPEIPPEKTAGGLYIPSTVGTRPARGKVLAKGPGKRNKKGQLRPLDVSVGDEVMFAEFAGTKVTVDGNDVLILREDEVLGIVTA